MTKTATAKTIQPGDRVQLETGEWVTITRKSKGMYLGSTLIEWNGKPNENWGHIMPGEEVPVQTQREV